MGAEFVEGDIYRIPILTGSQIQVPLECFVFRSYTYNSVNNFRDPRYFSGSRFLYNISKINEFTRHLNDQC